MTASTAALRPADAGGAVSQAAELRDAYSQTVTRAAKGGVDDLQRVPTEEADGKAVDATVLRGVSLLRFTLRPISDALLARTG